MSLCLRKPTSSQTSIYVGFAPISHIATFAILGKEITCSNPSPRIKRRGETGMKPSRRKFLRLVASTAALPAVSQIARAQAYPTRPVTMIVPFAPGGATDVVGRIVGEYL